MAWTTTDRDALKDAIASGATTVRYNDRQVTYRSLAEMRETLGMIESDIASSSGTARVRQIRFTTAKGF